MRAVARRLKSNYRYSKDVVYNNFISSKPTEAQKAKIEKTAQSFLKVFGPMDLDPEYGYAPVLEYVKEKCEEKYGPR